MSSAGGGGSGRQTPHASSGPGRCTCLPGPGAWSSRPSRARARWWPPAVRRGHPLRRRRWPKGQGPGLGTQRLGAAPAT
eukprot:5949981-Alexandrium_andersonii.AAC.1